MLNSYGMPGGIDTPTAEMLPYATLGVTIAYSDLAAEVTRSCSRPCPS